MSVNLLHHFGYPHRVKIELHFFSILCIMLALSPQQPNLHTKFYPERCGLFAVSWQHFAFDLHPVGPRVGGYECEDQARGFRTR
jgi:hypothetical protein